MSFKNPGGLLSFKGQIIVFIMQSYKNKEWMEEQYIKLGKTTYDIGRELGIAKTSVTNWLHKLGIPVRPRGMRGNGKGPRWTGGVMVQNGYIHLYKPNHPNAHPDGYIMEHRFIMEQHLGRYLKRDELVHHKDEDILNNYIGNLEIMTKSEHTKNHHESRRVMLYKNP